MIQREGRFLLLLDELSGTTDKEVWLKRFNYLAENAGVFGGLFEAWCDADSPMDYTLSCESYHIGYRRKADSVRTLRRYVDYRANLKAVLDRCESGLNESECAFCGGQRNPKHAPRDEEFPDRRAEWVHRAEGRYGTIACSFATDAHYRRVHRVLVKTMEEGEQLMARWINNAIRASEPL